MASSGYEQLKAFVDDTKGQSSSKFKLFNSLKDNLTDKVTSFSGKVEKTFAAQSSDDLGTTDNGWFSSAQKDSLLPSLSKRQRVIGFMICLLSGMFCFVLSSLYLPLLILKARKFSALFSLGSVFTLGSFSLLWGPVNHIKHLFSGPRLLFTSAYFGALGGTLYFALWARSTLFTVVFASLQILALVWYFVSYIPGGHTGLKFFSKIFYTLASKTAEKTLPL